ncbi:Clavaminate synthase-like protein [Lentithecium fluviatile CBS 122367]|uniref:Clavaminate synthase-like protein n=1 Tax=Lentithecium fluviatile CBS 122367 TaxID=1168545 RepID=A0A6G1J5M0_9PLEO|nr:Clavaminate synthase-like protein [Lentithecium fluviatile CBS 122367]
MTPPSLGLPPGFPQTLESDLVWDNTDIESRYNWTYVLTPADLEELESALEQFKSLGKPLGFVNQSTFPLPKLHARLREISREIHQTFGFKVICGIPVDNHTREEALIIYAGLASHVASIRGRQDHQWNGKSADVVLNHIKDLSDKVDANKIGAPAYTTDKQVFHTDSGDVIALLCLETAAEGGQSKLSSSWRVYNHLAEHRPDLIRTLMEPWPTDLFDEKGASYTNRPPLFHQPATDTSPERLIIQYARRTFTGFHGLPRSPHIPPITEAQAEALDALHFLAEKYAVPLDFQKGDIQFANNLSIFHARDGFRNTPEQQRHLVRLWLRDEELAWKLPKELKERMAKVFEGVEEEQQVFPLEPFVRSSAAGTSGK